MTTCFPFSTSLKRAAGLAFALAVALPLVACGPAEAPAENRATEVATAATEVAVPEPSPEQRVEAPSEEAAMNQPLRGGELPDEQATELMFDLLGPGDAADQARETILESGDKRFVSVFIELIRARQIGLVRGSFESYYQAAEQLSGQELGDDWPAWVTWYGGTDLTPPPGFTSWKGQLLAPIDDGFAEFLQDEHTSLLRVEEIQWGGVRVDGIPPLDNAPMIAGSGADYLRDEEPVFGLVVNGESRAYPLRIVDNHEMANDVIGGVPVSLSYCTLCGAAIAYDGRGPDGQTYTFGTSGFLYRSNKLMYDRPTRTLWNQLTGEPVLGELAGSDLRLEILPVVLTTWAEWLAQHPETLVLARDTGVYPAEFYEPGILYGDYFSSSETMFPVWQRSELLEDKAFVYVLQVNGIPKAYELAALAEERVVNDKIGDLSLVLVAGRGVVTIDGFNRRVGPVIYSNGGEVRAFERGEEVFAPGPDADTLLDSAGQPWMVTEEGLIGPEGQVAARIAGHLAYWFGWYAFFPQTLLYPEP